MRSQDVIMLHSHTGDTEVTLGNSQLLAYFFTHRQVFVMLLYWCFHRQVHSTFGVTSTFDNIHVPYCSTKHNLLTLNFILEFFMLYCFHRQVLLTCLMHSQKGTFDVKLVHSQTGIFHVILFSQTGTFNVILVHSQTGTFDIILLSKTGTFDVILLSKTGTFDVMLFSQTGTLNVIVFLQTGTFDV